ncbi:serine--tRNA ligase [Gemmatimonadetes bacterium T265]|nr:serine--tRNA ligase [Gemmatimonadetes bacterium T265]
MHDLKLLREQPDRLREGLARRGALDALAPVLDRLDALERERRAVIAEVEEKKAARNAATQEVARRKRANAPADDLVAAARALGDAIAAGDARRAAVDAELDALLLELPNVPLPEVPAGGEQANVVVRTWGEPRPSDGVRPHWEVGAALGLFDLERAVKVSGSGFACYRGAGARLVRALLNWCMTTHADEHGYEEVWPPALVSRASMTGTGQLPKFEDDAYRVAGDELFLVPTAEVPVTNLYRDELLDAAELPKAFVAYTPCFRREAGSAGKDTRGIQRLHQFDKVELVRYAAPERSSDELELLTRHAERLLQLLDLPYRVVLLAAGDTGFASAKTYDLEVWAPGVARWLEVSSCSVFTDFQARRANIRYRPAAGEKPRFVHTLNGSGLAFPRVIAALLEVHQRADGTVDVPAPLRPYVGAERLGPR